MTHHHPLTLETLRNVYKKQILDIAQRNDIENIRIFGSVARGEAEPDSDLDLLIARKTGGDAWGVGGFYHDIQQLMDCQVDIAMDGGLHPLLKDNILAEAVPL